MSLKGFHIFFIAVSALCTFGFGIWLLNGESGLNTLHVSAAAVAFLCTALLVLYGRRFLRKFKHIGYM